MLRILFHVFIFILFSQHSASANLIKTKVPYGVYFDSDNGSYQVWPTTLKDFMESSIYKSCQSLRRLKNIRLSTHDLKNNLSSCKNIKSWIQHQFNQASNLDYSSYHQNLLKLMSDYLKFISQPRHADGQIKIDDQLLQIVNRMRTFQYSVPHTKRYVGQTVEGDLDFVNKWYYMAFMFFDMDWINKLKVSKKVKTAPLKFFGKQVINADAYYITDIGPIKPKIYLTDTIYDNSFIINAYRDIIGPKPLILLLHELTHGIDRKLKHKFMHYFHSISSSEWKSIMNKENAPSFYSLLNHRESFAESLTAYFLDPWFKCYSPLKYEYLGKIIKINRELFKTSQPYEQVQCNTKAMKDIEIRFREMKKSYNKYQTKGDKYPFMINQKKIKKEPQAYCYKDEECDNQSMGCQTDFAISGFKVGRCRQVENSGVKASKCDLNKECQSKQCTNNICE